MLPYARELMDSENQTLSEIGYLIWNYDGNISPEALDDIAKKLLSLNDLIMDQPTLEDSFDAGFAAGYEEGKEAGEKKTVDQAIVNAAFDAISKK